MFRRTKIICTLGPSTHSPEKIKALIEAGANVFRLNMSHAKPEHCATLVPLIRQTAATLDMDVAVLMDLQGPSIRTGELPATIDLVPGDQVEIRQPTAAPLLPYSTTVNYPGLGNDVKIGATLLVDNGVLHFQVISRDAERVTCKVLTGGPLGSRRHINLPGTRVNLPALTEQDLGHIDLAAELAVDFVAMSFVRDAAHVRQLKALLALRDSKAKVVAKIEDQQAVQLMDEIIVACDVIMVARGDLGIEVPIEELPIIQRRLVAKCVHYGRKVIVATHMLESMIVNPMPTRAEMTDVANAVFEQTDAIMLSGETSTGKYPVECVDILDRIARRAEAAGTETRADHVQLKTDKMRIVRSAVLLADNLDDAKILVFTQRGVMAEHCSHFRPERAPIFAFTPTLGVARSLHLSRGVLPFVLDFPRDNPSATIELALSILRARHLVKSGDPIVIVSDILQGEFVMDAVLLKRV